MALTYRSNKTLHDFNFPATVKRGQEADGILGRSDQAPFTPLDDIVLEEGQCPIEDEDATIKGAVSEVLASNGDRLVKEPFIFDNHFEASSWGIGCGRE